MQLINFLFPQQDQRRKVHDLAKKVVDCVLDENEMLNRVAFCFIDGGKIFSPFLKELLPFFETAFSSIGREEIEIFVLKYYPNRMPFLKKTQGDHFIKYLMSFVLRDSVPQFDEYICFEGDNKKAKWDHLLDNKQFDRDGLLRIDDSMDLRPHGLILKQNRLFYHPFLRRGFNSLNNFHGLTFFLDKLSMQEGLDLKVKLDPIRLGEAKNYRDVVELDYWFGPPFSADKLNDKNYQGSVVYRNVTDPLLADKYSDRTEFNITNKKDGTKQIEIEEILVENPKISSKLKPQKYAHMIWDSKIGAFIHFDVAVMAYNSKTLNLRFHSQWKGKGAEPIKPDSKIKLFRADGRLTVEQIMELVSFFFYQNEQIHEFFSGQTI